MKIKYHPMNLCLDTVPRLSALNNADNLGPGSKMSTGN
jgi:hypothetical protein